MAAPYVDSDDAPAESLSDFRMEGNDLSVWQVEEDASNLNDVITALAACSMEPSNVDYLLFSSSIPESLKIPIKQTPGKTPSKLANHWHRDLSELSAKRAANLAARIFRESIQISRIPEKQVKSMLRDALTKDAIDAALMNEKLRNSIEQISS